MEGHVITPTETAAVDSSDEALADAGAQRVATPHRPAAFLSDVIVELGFVDAAVVERAEQEGRLHSRSVTDVLLENGELTEEQLARAIAQRSGLEYVDLDDFDIDLGAAELIGQSVARRYRAVPIASSAGGELVVAIADPVDALAADDIAVIAKSNVRTVVAGRSAIDAVITCLPEDAPPPPAPDELSQDDESERDSAPGAPPDDAEETTEGSPGLTAATEPTDPDPSGGTQPEARSAASRATASPRLQERIIQLIDSALDSAVESEAEALEAELASERDKRSDLEAELERERTSRSGERGEWMAEREALTEERDRLERERGELAELQREMGERVTAVSEKNAELQSLLAELRGSLDSADQRS